MKRIKNHMKLIIRKRNKSIHNLQVLERIALPLNSQSCQQLTCKDLTKFNRVSKEMTIINYLNFNLIHRRPSKIISSAEDLKTTSNGWTWRSMSLHWTMSTPRIHSVQTETHSHKRINYSPDLFTWAWSSKVNPTIW